MLPQGVYVLPETLKNTVSYVAGSKRWEHKRAWKAGTKFRVVINIQDRTKHLSTVALCKGWNITEGPLFALLASKLVLVEAGPPPVARAMGAQTFPG